METHIIVWMNMPSHHQSDYFYELSKLCKLQVNYTGKQENRRKAIGWISPKMRAFEQYKVFFLSQLLSLIKHRKSTHIITGCSSATNILIWLFCQILHIKWCHLSEDVPTTKQRNSLKSWIVKSYYKSVNSSALCAFAIGHKARRSFEFFNVNPEKIHITNYSSAIDNSCPIKETPSLPLKTLVLGELSPHKGTDILIDILSHFKEKLTVEFYGSIKEENKHMSVELSNLPNADYLGIIPSDKVQSLWTHYDLLIFPSRTDGWGMAVHEAVANNVPVICSEAAGCSEHLIINNFNGLITSPTTDSLSKAIEQYIKDPSLISIHSRHCQQHKGEYSPKATAKRFVQNLSLHQN